MHVNLPNNNNNADDFGRQGINPHLLHQVVRDAAENRAKAKRHAAFALVGTALAAVLIVNLWKDSPAPAPKPEKMGGGVPEMVYPDKPSPKVAPAKPKTPKVAPAKPKSEGQRWGESALPTDADTKTEGMGIAEYSAKQREIARLKKELEAVEKSVVSTSPAPVEKSLSEIEAESEAAIKAAREGKTKVAPVKEKGDGIRWGWIAFFGFVAFVVIALLNSAKHDDALHSALSINTGDGH